MESQKLYGAGTKHYGFELRGEGVWGFGFRWFFARLSVRVCHLLFSPQGCGPTVVVGAAVAATAENTKCLVVY